MERDNEFYVLLHDFITKSEHQLQAMKEMPLAQMCTQRGKISIELMRSEVVSSYLLLALFLSHYEPDINP